MAQVICLIFGIIWICIAIFFTDGEVAKWGCRIIANIYIAASFISYKTKEITK